MDEWKLQEMRQNLEPEAFPLTLLATSAMRFA
jgi:hypothetical protein